MSVSLDRLKELMPENCCWLEWRCQSHTDLISSIKLIHQPLSLLITSDDGRVSLCDVDGKRLGVLLTEPDPEAEWNFKIDVDGINNNEKDILDNVKDELTRLPPISVKLPKIDENIESSIGSDDNSRKYNMNELKNKLMVSIPRLKEKSVRDYTRFDVDLTD